MTSLSLFSAHALWAIDGDADRSLSALLNVMRNGTSYYKNKSTGFIGDMGKAASTAVPDLTVLKQEESPSIRRGAVVSLGKIGGAATSAISALKEIEKNDPIQSVWKAAQDSLRLIQSYTLRETAE